MFGGIVMMEIARLLAAQAVATGGVGGTSHNQTAAGKVRDETYPEDAIEQPDPSKSESESPAPSELDAADAEPALPEVEQPDFYKERMEQEAKTQEELDRIDEFDLTGEKRGAEALEREDQLKQESIEENAAKEKEFFAQQDEQQKEFFKEQDAQAEQQVQEERTQEFWDDKKAEEVGAQMDKDVRAIDAEAHEEHESGTLDQEEAAKLSEQRNEVVGEYEAEVETIEEAEPVGYSAPHSYSEPHSYSSAPEPEPSPNYYDVEEPQKTRNTGPGITFPQGGPMLNMPGYGGREAIRPAPRTDGGSGGNSASGEDAGPPEPPSPPPPSQAPAEAAPAPDAATPAPQKVEVEAPAPAIAANEPRASALGSQDAELLRLYAQRNKDMGNPNADQATQNFATQLKTMEQQAPPAQAIEAPNPTPGPDPAQAIPAQPVPAQPAPQQQPAAPSPGMSL
jgi:hypothetical protein